jgi:hypothetical protein
VGVENKPVGSNLAAGAEESKTMSDVIRLISIARKADSLAREISRESEPYRLAGRLNRLIQFQFSNLTEREVATFAEAYVDQSKAGEDPFTNDQGVFYPLQSAIAQVSYRMWEGLWNEHHPDSSGKAWDGEDFALMSIWREKVRNMIRECRQGAALEMSAEEYVARLIEGGASEDATEQLVEWLAEVEYEGTTPST